MCIGRWNIKLFNKYDVTIANGESLSSIIELSKNEIPVGLEVGSWTTASITFLVGFSSVQSYYKDGDEYELSGVIANSVHNLPLTDFVGIKNIQLRSGTRSAAVAQGGTRTITLITAEIT